jgi:hypothetical protein
VVQPGDINHDSKVTIYRNRFSLIPTLIMSGGIPPFPIRLGDMSKDNFAVLRFNETIVNFSRWILPHRVGPCVFCVELSTLFEPRVLMTDRQTAQETSSCFWPKPYEAFHSLPTCLFKIHFNIIPIKSTSRSSKWSYPFSCTHRSYLHTSFIPCKCHTPCQSHTLPFNHPIGAW